MKITIVDYGVGNLRSVERALVHAGAEVAITSDGDELERAAGLTPEPAVDEPAMPPAPPPVPEPTG